jgi:hypothetical protein
MHDHADMTRAIRALCQQQHLAVLCTQDSGQPYASLVAFAVTDDLRYLCFATQRDTRKHRNLTACPRVAVLVDSRREYPSDLREASALTICGRVITPDAASLTECQARYAARHPSLAAFLAEPTTELVVIAITQLVLVDDFQQVCCLDLTPPHTPPEG